MGRRRRRQCQSATITRICHLKFICSMSMRKGPPVGHYAPVNLGKVESIFNTLIEDAEAGRATLCELTDKYPKGVPVGKIDAIKKLFFDMILKLEGGRLKIVDASGNDSFDSDVFDEEEEDADADTSMIGPQAKEYYENDESVEGDADVQSTQK